MSDTVIQVENLGKKYRIQHQREAQRYAVLRDVLMEKAGAPWRWLKLCGPNGHGRSNGGQAPGVPSSHVHPPASEDFWALKGVSFEVKRGEVVGIIGRNGAGKTTLLKILSRITEPTEGRVRLRGRVASLLEVGTGFHPELTGRENIFLNGAVLGMSKAEIKRKFDEIVAFAEVETFLDTPVKRYSSGMYVRLAFAVAAHLEPEILVVDEVLAVGDAEFQKRSLGRMRAVSQGGRTVLFVSHNLSMITALCSRAVLLDRGAVKLDGAATDCVQEYLKQYTGLDSFRRAVDRSDRVKIVAGKIAYAGEATGLRMSVELQVWSDADCNLSLDLRLSEGAGSPVGFGSLGTLSNSHLVEFRRGITEVIVSFPTHFLANGAYALSLDVTIPFREYLDRAERCLSFNLERPASVHQERVPSQRWGYGSLEIPLSLDRLSNTSTSQEICSGL